MQTKTTTKKPQWNRGGITVGSRWNHGESRWDHGGIMVESRWDHGGITVEPRWNHGGITVGESR